MRLKGIEKKNSNDRNPTVLDSRSERKGQQNNQNCLSS
jgi:hypothetical protein